MSLTLQPMTAGEVYDQALEPHPRGRVGRVAAAALDLWCAASGGLLELSSVGDVVVRRRVDGVEELRLSAGPRESAASTLAYVREQLDTLSPDEFRSQWGMAELVD